MPALLGSDRRSGGIAIAPRMTCNHVYGRLVALGIATNFFLYAFVNIADGDGGASRSAACRCRWSRMAGSAMITVMIGFGLLMSVHVHRDVAFSETRHDD